VCPHTPVAIKFINCITFINIKGVTILFEQCITTKINVADNLFFRDLHTLKNNRYFHKKVDIFTHTAFPSSNVVTSNIIKQ